MPRGLSSGIKTAIAADTVRPVYLLYCDFDGYAMRSWSGEGDLSYDSETWSGDGRVVRWPRVEENVSLVASNITIALSGQHNYDEDISDPDTFKGRSCELYIGFLDSSGDLPEANVYRLFSGRMSSIEYVEDAAADEYSLVVESRLVDLAKSKSIRYTHQSQRQRWPGGVTLSSGALTYGETYEVVDAGTGADFSNALGPASPAVGDKFVAYGTSVTWGSPSAELKSLPDKGLEYAARAQNALFLSRGEKPEKPFSRKIIYGTTLVEGSVVFVATSGPGSRYLNLVIAFADHECAGIDQVYFDGRPILSGGSVSGEFAGVVNYYPKLGVLHQNYVFQLKNEVSDTVWDQEYRLRGVCYAYFRILYSEKLFGESAPAITALIRGKKLYDPRTESTAHSNNAALVVRDYLLSEDYGFNGGAAEVDDDSFSVAANDCDLFIATASGVSERKYTIDGYLDTAAETGENLKTLLSAMAGKLSYIGGVFALYAGRFALTSLGIPRSLVASEVNFSTGNQRESYNGARGIYRTSALDWQEEDYPPYQDADALAEDGSPRWLDLPLPMTTSAARAQRLAKIAVQRSRAIRTLQFDVMLGAFDVRAGDVIAVDVGRNDIGNHVYEVIQLVIVLDIRPRLELELVKARQADYAWLASEETQLTVPEQPADSILSWTQARLNAPSGTPGSQTFNVGFDVIVSHNESGVTVRYTTDGSEPTESDSSIANGGTIAIGTSTTTLKLKSFQNSGSLTSAVVTYEYDYQAPTDQVPEPDHRWSWDEHISDADNNYPVLKYAISGLDGADIYNTENGGATWSLLRSPASDGDYYLDATEIPSSWNPSDYRAYGEKVAFVDSNQLIIPDQSIPPLLWGQNPTSGTWNKLLGIQCFGTNCTIHYRFATKQKSGGDWSLWSSYKTVSGKGWGDIIGTRFPNLTLETEFTDFEYEVYVSQSGFTDSVVMYINSDTRDIKYGGEDGTLITGVYSYKSGGYS